MRKVLSILLVLIVCASMMSLTAFAASGSMSATGAEVAAGSSTTVTVSLTSNPGVMAYQVVPSVPEGFTIKMQGTGMGGGVWTTGMNAFWDNGSDSTYTGAILTVTVTADADVEPGTYTISFSAAGSNYNEEDVSFGSCVATITVPAPAHEHDFKFKETVAPTCENMGYDLYECSCGETKKENEKNALGHKWGEGVITTPAGCETTGVKTYTCTVDGCGKTKTEEIPANGHSFGEWKVTKAATCTEKGEETRECACGEKETREIAVKDHALNSYGKDATHHWALCDDCDYVGEKTAHSYDYNGVCECGATKPVVNDPNLDDVPKTSDITPYIAMASVMFLAVIAAMAFLLKRKAVK